MAFNVGKNLGTPLGPEVDRAKVFRRNARDKVAEHFLGEEEVLPCAFPLSPFEKFPRKRIGHFPGDFTNRFPLQELHPRFEMRQWLFCRCAWVFPLDHSQHIAGFGHHKRSPATLRDGKNIVKLFDRFARFSGTPRTNGNVQEAPMQLLLFARGFEQRAGFAQPGESA